MNEPVAVPDASPTKTGLRGAKSVSLPASASTPPVSPAPVLLYLLPQGWSAMLNSEDDKSSRPNQVFPYTEDTDGLLRDLDCERMPRCLADLFDVHCQGRFVRGALDIEVRDYRPAAIQLETDADGQTTAMPGVRRVRLRPTHDVVLGKFRNLYHEARQAGNIKPRAWSATDWVGLEQRLLRRLRPPVCLDPSPLVLDLATLIHYNRTKYTGLVGHPARLVPGAAEGADGRLEELDPRVGSQRAVRPVVAFLNKHRPVETHAGQQSGADDAAARSGDSPTGPTVEQPPSAPIIPVLEQALKPINRKLQLTVDANLPVTPAAFYKTMFSAAERHRENSGGTHGPYERNIVEVRQHPIEEHFEVCVRSLKETSFDPPITYAAVLYRAPLHELAPVVRQLGWYARLLVHPAIRPWARHRPATGTPSPAKRRHSP